MRPRRRFLLERPPPRLGRARLVPGPKGRDAQVQPREPVVAGPRPRGLAQAPAPGGARDVGSRLLVGPPVREGALLDQGHPRGDVAVRRRPLERHARRGEGRFALRAAALLLQGAPARPQAQDLLGRPVGHRRRLGEQGLQARLRQHRVQPRLDGPVRRRPVLPVHRARVGLHQEVRLDPRPVGAAGHRDVLQLGAAESALDLDVPRALAAQVLLPPPSARPHPPDEEFPPFHPPRRRVHKAAALRVEARDPRAVPLRDAVEVVVGRRDVRRVTGVDPVADRHGNLFHLARVPVLVGRLGGDDDAVPLGLGDGDVRPPVHRRLVGVRVDDARPHQQHRLVGRHHGVDLEQEAAEPVVFPEAQRRPPVVGAGPRRKEGRARVGRVGADGDVPLDPAAEPRVPHRHVREVEDARLEEEFAAGRLVHERPQPPAQAQEERRPQVRVLEDRRLQPPLDRRPVVPVLEAVGQAPVDVVRGRVDERRLARRVLRRGRGRRHVRQRVLAPQRRHPQAERFGS